MASNIPGLIYEMVPNLRRQNKYPETNSMGISDREYEIPKPPSTLGILILGDSVGYGID